MSTRLQVPTRMRVAPKWLTLQLPTRCFSANVVSYFRDWPSTHSRHQPTFLSSRKPQMLQVKHDFLWYKPWEMENFVSLASIKVSTSHRRECDTDFVFPTWNSSKVHHGKALCPIQNLWWYGDMVSDICSENMGIRDPIIKNIELGRRSNHS